MELINYEVQVQQNGRWSIHARFQANQKDDAIKEGKELDQLNSIEAVKVIKEVYDPDEGFHNEFIVYKSPSMKSSLGAGGKGKSFGSYASRGGAQDMSWLEDDLGDDEAAPTRRRKSPGRVRKSKKASSLTSVLVKLLLVVLFSLLIGGLFAALADEMLSGVKLFGIKFVGNAKSNLMISVFGASFLISAAMMAVTVMRGASLATSNRPRPVRKQARKAPQPRRKTVPKPAKNSPGEGAAAGPSAEIMGIAKENTLGNLEDAMKGVGEFQVEQPTARERAPENESVEERLRASLEKASLPEKAKAQEPTPEVDALSPADKEHKAYMLKFLNSGLEGSQSDKNKMDNFNKFGVNLYLAGACEVLSQKRGMDLRTRSKILSESVQVMGFKRSHAASFADRYEEYLMADARYMQMFQAGRNAINIFLTDETVAPRLLDSALAEWNKPKTKEEQTGPITVLFTDIAGSLAMTQELGDAGAQQVIRAHNRIVREALSNNAGKEIKHTGDGIMASFMKTSDGVDASIEMQRETALHTEQNPDLPLHLKIGLNAGEPIAEDNDLFGATVQLSARITDKASADQIFVSEIVRGICAGKRYNFNNRGGFAMKGFGEEVTLYEVMWSKDD